MEQAHAALHWAKIAVDPRKTKKSDLLRASSASEKYL